MEPLPAHVQVLAGGVQPSVGKILERVFDPDGLLRRLQREKGKDQGEEESECSHRASIATSRKCESEREEVESDSRHFCRSSQARRRAASSDRGRVEFGLVEAGANDKTVHVVWRRVPFDDLLHLALEAAASSRASARRGR